MKVKVNYTHKGFFGIAPIYLASIDTECPEIIHRNFLVLPLVHISVAIWALIFWLKGVADPAYQPEWPMLITGPLKKPITREYEVGD